MNAIDPQAVLRILTQEDIEGLLVAGAPADEYETEAQMIAAALGRVRRSDLILDDVTTIVTDVCSRMFGPFDDEQLRRRQPIYRRVAQRLLELYPQP